MHKKKYVSVRSFNEHKVQKKTGGVEVLAQNRLSFAHCGFWDRFSTGARVFCFFAFSNNKKTRITLGQFVFFD